jgi:EAL domain-containing protein (putative c-di-GMP-specific phosphodiesterase class I)
MDADIPFSCSVGVAVAEDEDDVESLIRKADVAMYAAKANGKSRFETFDRKLHEKVLDRMRLEARLEGAADRGEFELHYQPIIDLKTNGILGFESLLRWSHPERGLLFPGSFLEIAESSPEIFKIGRWVLMESCRVAGSWKEASAGRRPFFVSVNLSARQFDDPELVPAVERALNESGLPAHCLVLEITESILMLDKDAEKANALKALGVKLALDDFGTGYSSLSYLHRFPVDVIKMDRSIVRGLGGGPQEEAVGQAIIQLAQALKMPVVAEGIEIEEQAATLRNLGCDRGQGFYFAKPQSSEAALELLRDEETPADRMAAEARIAS